MHHDRAPVFTAGVLSQFESTWVQSNGAWGRQETSLAVYLHIPRFSLRR